MVNNLYHQQGDVHISATVSFVWMFSKITKSAKCIKNMSISSTIFQKKKKNAISTHIVIIVDTLTENP